MSYFQQDSIIFNLFKIIIITLLLEYFVKGLEVEQGSNFILTCFQSNKTTTHSLSLTIIDNERQYKCISNCKDKVSPQCNRLRQGTSNISCEPLNCHFKQKCNFMFTSPSIRLNGVKVGCQDGNENGEEWNIKGSSFSYFVNTWVSKTIINNRG